MRFAVILVLLAGMARAEAERAAEFDYYVMALSWTPSWCALEGDARGSEQCDARHDHGWTLHGLWPQFHRGWPSYCRTPHRSPSRGQTAAMADIMGSGGLAWHQWKKHGVCSGLDAQAYFKLSREAYGSVTRPPVFRKLQDPVKVPASVVEQAFLEANPALEPDMITITCRQNRIQEARICLSKDLEPVPCGQDVIRDCRMTDALLDPVR